MNPGTVARTPDFESGTIGHSVISPFLKLCNILYGAAAGQHIFPIFLRAPRRLSEVLRVLRVWFYGKYWLPKAANLNVILEIRFWIYGKYRNPKAAICDCENLDGFWDYENAGKPKGKYYAKARLRFRKNVFRGERGIGR